MIILDFCALILLRRRRNMLLEGKVAIITGGARGMGRGMAVRFAAEGCAVAIADIAVEEAGDAAAGINKKGGKALAIKCDVTDIKQVGDTVAKVIRNFGKIDILVNNAGAIAAHTPVEDLTEKAWDKVLALNLKSDFLFCKFVVPYMKKQKSGKIINLSSIGAVHPPAHEIHYNTAKAGVIGFTTDLANALAPFNINVNCMLPGPIRTNFYDQRTGAMTDGEREAFFIRLGKKVPLGRVGTPEDMAGAALFLASELSDYITGHALYVSGGLPLQPLPA
jgi:NAD(P)-dependent dehydrogenase (short-subunit alcohol dehydrogenase family)